MSHYSEQKMSNSHNLRLWVENKTFSMPPTTTAPVLPVSAKLHLVDEMQLSNLNKIHSAHLSKVLKLWKLISYNTSDRPYYSNNVYELLIQNDFLGAQKGFLNLSLLGKVKILYSNELNWYELEICNSVKLSGVPWRSLLKSYWVPCRVLKLLKNTFWAECETGLRMISLLKLIDNFSFVDRFYIRCIKPNHKRIELIRRYFFIKIFIPIFQWHVGIKTEYWNV